MIYNQAESSQNADKWLIRIRLIDHSKEQLRVNKELNKIIIYKKTPA